MGISGQTVLLPGAVVDGPGVFASRYAREGYGAGVVEPGVVAALREWCRDGTSRVELSRWLERFRGFGYRAVRGDRTVSTVPLDDPVLVFRLAAEWDAGLSWAMDSRCCSPGAWFSAGSARWWAAVVEPKDVLATFWATSLGEPVWRTVEHETLGRVTVALDDHAETLVDPSGLVESDVLGVGRVVSLN